MCAFTVQKSGTATVTAILRSNFDAVNAQGFHIDSIDHGTISNWKPHSSMMPFPRFSYSLVMLATWRHSLTNWK